MFHRGAERSQMAALSRAAATATDLLRRKKSADMERLLFVVFALLRGKEFIRVHLRPSVVRHKDRKVR